MHISTLRMAIRSSTPSTYLTTPSPLAKVIDLQVLAVVEVEAEHVVLAPPARVR